MLPLAGGQNDRFADDPRVTTDSERRGELVGLITLLLQHKTPAVAPQVIAENVSKTSLLGTGSDPALDRKRIAQIHHRATVDVVPVAIQ